MSKIIIEIPIEEGEFPMFGEFGDKDDLEQLKESISYLVQKEFYFLKSDKITVEKVES